MSDRTSGGSCVQLVGEHTEVGDDEVAEEEEDEDDEEES